MNCAKCSAQLSSIVVDGIEVDRCGDCEGIWFDRTELGRLLDSSERQPALLSGKDDGTHDAKPGGCPRDGQTLVRVRSVRNNRVTVDTCPQCRGIWLDGGEFRRIKEEQPGIRLGEIV